jgi:hypothetical protein
MNMRGTIQSYDKENATGIILSDGQTASLSFQYPYHLRGLLTFEKDDQVEFQIESGKVVDIRIERPADVFKDVHRCSVCRQYMQYREVKPKKLDGDWGDYVEYYCNTCGSKVSGAGRFMDAYTQYMNGKMSESEKVQFEAGLIDRSLLNDFLNGKFQFH